MIDSLYVFLELIRMDIVLITMLGLLNESTNGTKYDHSLTEFVIRVLPIITVFSQLIS